MKMVIAIPLCRLSREGKKKVELRGREKETERQAMDSRRVLSIFQKERLISKTSGVYLLIKLCPSLLHTSRRERDDQRWKRERERESFGMVRHSLEVQGVLAYVWLKATGDVSINFKKLVLCADY